MATELENRAKALINDRLFCAYWDGVDHYEDTDLILYLDTEQEELQMFVRERFIEPSDVPLAFKQKFSKPAKDTAVNLKGGSTAFWFMASFPEGMYVTAVIAQRVGNGGEA